MFLRQLELNNVKCFAKGTSIDFCVGKDEPHRWVVVYGDNGLGKSTLLKAIGIALTGKPALNRLLPSAEGWVRGNAPMATIHATFTKGPGDVSKGFPRQRPIGITWNLVGSRAKRLSGNIAPAGSIELDDGRTKPEKDDAKLFRSQIAADDPNRGWLVCGYGPHRRLSGAASDIAESVPSDGRAARLVTLFHEKAALTSAERWLRDLHHQALEKKHDAQARLEAVKRMLNHGLLEDRVEIERISHAGVSFRTPFSAGIPMDDLADGYRTSLALSLDLLRHVSYCFAVEKVFRERDGHAWVDAEGVVLVDEIDSHLHPSWQRTIAGWLHQAFPRMQFIVATHSPLIPTRVSEDDGMVVRLERRTQGRGQVVDAVTEQGRIGLTADQNLTSPNFGLASTRDVLIDVLLAEIRQLRERVRQRKAGRNDRARLRQLQLKFDEIAPATETFADAKSWQDRTRSAWGSGRRTTR